MRGNMFSLNLQGKLVQELLLNEIGIATMTHRELHVSYIGLQITASTTADQNYYIRPSNLL